MIWRQRWIPAEARSLIVSSVVERAVAIKGKSKPTQMPHISDPGNWGCEAFHWLHNPPDDFVQPLPDNYLVIKPCLEEKHAHGICYFTMPWASEEYITENLYLLNKWQIYTQWTFFLKIDFAREWPQENSCCIITLIKYYWIPTLLANN